MRERTSTGLMGIYFGHIKAYALSPKLEDFEAIMSYISFCIGYSFLDQKTLINTIIKKKRKRNIVRHLQIINLIEADFNFNNKVMARLVIACTEKNNLILAEQCSSRKLHKAIN